MNDNENGMAVNGNTSTETGHIDELSTNSTPEVEDTNENSGESVSDSTDQGSKETDGGAPLTNDEIRELMKHGNGFGNGMNPEALERLMNQPGPDTKALLERISGVLEIQDGNIGKAFTKINDLELKVTALTATNKFTTIIAITAIIVAIIAIIL